MPHSRCETCKVRLHVKENSAQLVGDLCPECGSLMEPVVDLAGLTGYRMVGAPVAGADPAGSARAQRIAGRVDEFVTRREAQLERDRAANEAERWFDDDVAVAAELALRPPRPSL